MSRRIALVIALGSLAVAASWPPRVNGDDSTGHVRGEVRLLGALSVPRDSDNGILALGGGLSLGAAWSTIPLTLGFEILGFTGPEERVQTYLVSDGQRLPVTSTRSDQTLLLDFWLRAQPADWVVRPYAEAFLGYQFVSAKYLVEFTNGIGAVELTDRRAWLGTWGWGLGAELNIAGASRAAYLTLGFRQTYAEEARFTRIARMPRSEVPIERRVTLGGTMVSIGLAGIFDFGVDRRRGSR